jgi:PhnB protein
MKNLQIYLNFNGNCEEAMNFYKANIGGEIKNLSRYQDSPVEVHENFKAKINHIEWECEGIFLMAADGMNEQNQSLGSNVSLIIIFDNEEEQKNIFDKLSLGGKVLMPLQITYWGAKFGMLTDKFGVNWMLNFQIRKD